MPKNDFDQQTACGAPVCWLKYTTQGYLNNELVTYSNGPKRFDH